MEDNKDVRQLSSSENLLFIAILDLARLALNLKSSIRVISASERNSSWKEELNEKVNEADKLFEELMKSIEAVRFKE